MRVIILIIFQLFFNHAYGGCLQEILANGGDARRSELRHAGAENKTVSYVFDIHKYNLGFLMVSYYDYNDAIGRVLMLSDGAYVDSYEHAVDPSTGKSSSMHCELRTCKKIHYQGGLYIYYPSDLGGSFERVLEKDGKPYAVLRIFTEEPVTSLEELFAGHTCNEPYNEEVYQFLTEVFK